MVRDEDFHSNGFRITFWEGAENSLNNLQKNRITWQKQIW